MLELMRRRLRALVKLLAKTKQAIVYTDIPDEVGELKEIDPHRVAVGVDADRFRAKARQYPQAHLDHVALQKVRRNSSSPRATAARWNRCWSTPALATQKTGTGQ